MNLTLLNPALMADINYETKTVLAATAQLLGFIMQQFCEYGVTLSLKAELSDLDGLVDPEKAHSDVDFALLNVLEDPVVKIIVASNRRMDELIDTLMNLNAMDRWEAMHDDVANELAEDVYYRFEMLDLEVTGYNCNIININMAYLYTNYMIYIMAKLCGNGGIDIDVEGEHYWENPFRDLDPELLDRENINVSLLYHLILERQAEDRQLEHFFR